MQKTEVAITGYFSEFVYTCSMCSSVKAIKKKLNKEFLEIVECSYDTWQSYDQSDPRSFTRSQAILDQFIPEKGRFLTQEEFEEKIKSGQYRSATGNLF